MENPAMKHERTVWIGIVAATLMVTTIMVAGSRAADKPAAAVPTKVAVVDMSFVFDSYDRSKDEQQDLRKKQEEAEGKLKQMRDRVEALKAELENFNPDSKDYVKRHEELLKLTIEFDVYRRVQVENVATEMRVLYEEIYGEMITAVEAVAKEHGLDLVLYKDEVKILKDDKLDIVRDKILQRKVLYSDKTVDLTDAVLQHLNQQFKIKQAQKGS
jgi:Skp family chaperone for outer membrane proteins